MRGKRRCAVLSSVVLVVVASTTARVSSAVGAATSPSPVVVLDVAGTGSSRTSAFKVPDQWNLRWSFDCSQSANAPGTFSVEMVEAGSPPRHDPQIPRLLRFATSGFGVERYLHGGYRAFLRIASQCAWTVRAVRLPA